MTTFSPNKGRFEGIRNEGMQNGDSRKIGKGKNIKHSSTFLFTSYFQQSMYNIEQRKSAWRKKRVIK